jgi:hypothetical protein
MEIDVPVNRHDRRKEARHGADAPVREPVDTPWPTTRDPADWPTRDTFLSRIELSAEFEKLGIPCAPSTLSTKATRGGGPPFVKFWPYARYRWGTAYDWAMARLTAPRSSTSEDATEQSPLDVQALPRPRGRPKGVAPELELQNQDVA